MSEIIYVSKEGMELLSQKTRKAEDDLNAIRKEKAIAYTSTGDTWHDNPYFNKLEQDEQTLVRTVLELRGQIASAKMIPGGERNTTRVRLGSIVRVHRYYKVSGEEEEFVWEIVGYGETDMPKKRIAYNAPVIRAILGLHIEETVHLKSPKGPAECTVRGLFANWEDVPEQFKQ